MKQLVRTAIVLAQLAAVGSTGCSARLRSQPSSMPPASEDEGVFAAVVQAVIDSATRPVRIDPWPVAQVDTERLALPTRATVGDAIVSGRRRTLQELRVPVGDLSVPKRCLGTMAAPDETGTLDRSGCPKQLMLIVGVSLPHPHSDSASPSPRDYRAVRVPQLLIGPDGFSAVVYEYIVTSRGSTWTVVSRRPLLFIE